MNIKRILTQKGTDIVLDRDGLLLKEIHRYRKPRKTRIIVLDFLGIAASLGYKAETYNPLAEYNINPHFIDLILSAIGSGFIFDKEMSHWNRLLSSAIQDVVLQTLKQERKENQNLVYAFHHPKGCFQSLVLNEDLIDPHERDALFKGKELRRNLTDFTQRVTEMSQMERNTIFALLSRATRWIACPSLHFKSTNTGFTLTEIAAAPRSYAKIIVVLPRILTDAQKRWLWMFLLMAVNLFHAYYLTIKNPMAFHLGTYASVLKGHQIFEKPSQCLLTINSAQNLSY